MFLAVLCGMLGLLCISANFLLLTYYIPRRGNVIPFVYLSLVSCDLLSGVAAIATSVTLGYLLQTSTYQDHTIILTSYSVASFTCRFSTWVSLVLVLVRTVSIVTPHVTLRRGHVVPVIMTCFLLTLTLLGMEHWSERDIGRPSIWHRVRFNLVFNMAGRRMILFLGRKLCLVFSHEVIWTLCVILPFVIPALVALIAMLVQIYYMGSRPGTASRKNSVNRRITVTILVLTSVYVAVNTLYFITTIVFLHGVRDMSPYMSLALFITSTILPFISSLVNPTIMIIRGKKIRQHVLRVVRCGDWRRSVASTGSVASGRVSGGVP